MKKKIIQLRVTENQAQYLQKKADKKEMNLSEYIRMEILKDYQRE